MILTHIESIFKKYYNNLESTKKTQSLSQEEILTLNFVFDSEQKNLSDSIRNIEFFVDNINNFNDFDINVELEKESNKFNFNEFINTFKNNS